MTAPVFFLLIPLSLSLCQAQRQEPVNVAPVPGFTDLHWGMAPTDILEAFKGQAKLIPKRQILYPVDGSPDLVRIDKLIVDGISYRVQFAFDTDFTAYFNRVT